MTVNIRGTNSIQEMKAILDTAWLALSIQLITLHGMFDLSRSDDFFGADERERWGHVEHVERH